MIFRNNSFMICFGEYNGSEHQISCYSFNHLMKPIIASYHICSGSIVRAHSIDKQRIAFLIHAYPESSLLILTNSLSVLQQEQLGSGKYIGSID